MEVIFNNIGWILLAISVGLIFFFKKTFNDSRALTGKYKTSGAVKGDKEDAVRLIICALKRAGFVKTGFDSEDDRFYAQSKISMSSWTEYIEIKLNESNSNEQQFEFLSICALPTQIFDWGKNKRNAKRFMKALSEEG